MPERSGDLRLALGADALAAGRRFAADEDLDRDGARCRFLHRLVARRLVAGANHVQRAVAGDARGPLRGRAGEAADTVEKLRILTRGLEALRAGGALGHVLRDLIPDILARGEALDLIDGGAVHLRSPPRTPR